MAIVLLIEPDYILSRLYGRALTSAGYQVERCIAAQEAIARANERQPDAVIMELQLVGHSGLEFLYEFRSYTDWRHVPVILLTQVPLGEFSECQHTLQQQLGVCAYLYKPHTDLKALLSRLRTVQIGS